MTTTSRAAMGGGPAESDWRELDTTPEFREFVGKKLDELVSGMIKEKDRSKHLRPAPEEGSVCLFAGAPPLEVTEPVEPEPPPPAKRPKLSGVELQRYQLKKKARRDRKKDAPDAEKPSDAEPAAEVSKPALTEDGTGAAADEKAASDAADSDSDSDDDMARFAEAAVPADFMKSLAKSKTVKLDKA